MGFYDLGRDLADDFYNDEDYLDEHYLDDDEEEEEEERPDLLLWPQWLHPDCPDPCTALDLGTCCKYPTEPVVRRAVELADSVERTLSRAGREQCAVVAAGLARLFLSVPAVLAQVHAVLPSVSETAAAQLLCPVGRLSGALDQACAYGCPWACDDPEVPDRRAEFEPLGTLLEQCSDALRAAFTRSGPG